MKTDLPPWKEDPNNPTRKSGEKRTDKYGNQIKNVAKHLARKAMNTVKETVFVSSRKKDLTAAKSEDTLVFDDHINCGTPDCCQTCDTADTKEISEELVEDNDMPKGLQDRSPRGSARGAMGRAIAKQERNLTRARMDRAKKAGANLKMDPDTGTPDHFTAAMRRKKGLPEEAKPDYSETGDAERIRKRQEGDQKTRDAEKAFEKRAKSIKHAAEFLQRYKGVKEEVELEETEGKVYSVHVKGDSAQHNSPEFKKHLAGWGGEHHYTSDKGAAYKFKKEYQANGFHHGVRSMFKKLDSEHDGLVKEEVEQVDESLPKLTDNQKYAAIQRHVHGKTFHAIAKDMGLHRQTVATHAGNAMRILKRRNVDIKDYVKEELGKSNEWGTDSLRKKFAAMTPGQEGLAAKNIPTFDARYDDVPTKYCGGIQKEETLSEISARGVIARQDFKAKLQKVLSDPKAIARAKKTIAKKKAAEADVPKNLVHQLHKSQSINAKVKFYDGKEHEIASNHHDKFMNKYHGLKSSIEKESLVNRAHKSHEEFLKAIHEEWADFSQEKPNTDSINPANYPTPPMHDDMLDYNSDDRHDEYDMVAIENDVTSEIENAEWADLVDYYDYEDLNYEDSDEDIAEGITPQGRLKKRFNMMRTKGRRNLARNMALKRVATPDRIKSRSVRAARNMVYSRVLRGRDRSSLSASEKTRLEGMVKRMAPMVGRLSIRLQQKERMIDRKRINNRNKRKKK